MRTIALIFALTFVLGCKKNDTKKQQYCYHCSNAGSAGATISKDTCTATPLTSAIALYDANGNPVNVICTEK